MERAEYHRHSRALCGRNDKRGIGTCNAGRAGAYRPWEALHPTRSSDVLTRIARERVPTAGDYSSGPPSFVNTLKSSSVVVSPVT